ncbi:L-serine ammonia-lyase, iron-sulfur-dependent subunit beta [Anaerocolumna sp. AGMB13025]|uniref:L-serine ammonia-lyase, iron-sulfur-dependent subunit beta n=1 Tax=Anaerocolumna sp. AGMB13025 TaxID=3039116 RepID=UPI00241DC6FF|nr:L-serine ammonia-lyase, iron-sulfur-dependent subunit beta [Anaerocolumna sp. AGMB13025]WFR55265.1 L-serine ammonia-lyase, iron-sulfur-dependent subunit beta [Anaerocolumna sp. AGMB13025]
MYASKEMSVFDIIGPNMIGPSSSHTAGALRIARLARNMVKRPIKQVKFILYGSFAQTYQGHGTDRALVAGMLGFDTEDYRIKESFAHAKETGLYYVFETNIGKPDIHPNTVDIIITDEENEETSVTGISIGGGRAVIKKINGVEIDLSGDYHTLVIRHKDLPGVVAGVTNILSKFDINIAFMKLYRENKGTIAYSIIETDQPIDEDVIDKIEELNSVFNAFLIEKL